MDVHLSNGGAQLALDLTPRLPVDVTARFIDYLRSEPSANEVAQELVVRYLGQFNARAAILSRVEPDASLVMIGSFGLDDATREQLGTRSLWDSLPTARAICEQRTLVLSGTELTADAFPGLASAKTLQHSVVAVPLMTASSTVGSICVCFQTEAPTAALAARILEAIADIYVLYLLSTKGARGAAVFDSSSAPLVPAAKKPARDDSTFTRRQLAILSLLGEGMTYDQIAARIGYSHSTVRMELMQMYRVLGVSSRREAVEIAMRRGMLDSRPVGDAVLVSHRTE